MKFVVIPVSSYFRRQSLKGCFHDANNNPMKTTQKLGKLQGEFVKISSMHDGFSGFL